MFKPIKTTKNYNQKTGKSLKVTPTEHAEMAQEDKPPEK